MAETNFEFITLRQAERVNQKVRRLRYISDLRPAALAPVREQLKNTDVFQQKLAIAEIFKLSPLFFKIDHYYTFNYETIVDSLREVLTGPSRNRDGVDEPGAPIGDVIALLEARLPVFQSSAFFTAPSLPAGVIGGIFLQYALIFDSLYCSTVLAGVLRQQTSYIIDALRALHVLAALRIENMRSSPTEFWPYFDFDAFEAVVDNEIL